MTAYPQPAVACARGRGACACFALTIFLAFLALAGPQALTPAAYAADVEEWPLEKFREPSGIVYHPGRDTLFIVGDAGDIGEVSLDGELIRSRNIGGDLEGVTCDPATGLLYVVREGHEILFEIAADDFRLMRRFTIDRTFERNANFLERGGNGIEGLTFVPDSAHPEGGRFFAVNQFDPPVLLELEVPLRTSADRFSSARIVAAHRVGSAPLSGVTWDAGIEGFLVVSALWRSVYVASASGERLRSVRIPGFMQEGLAVLPDGSFVIAQDTGGLLKWNPEKNPFGEDGEQANAGKGEKVVTSSEDESH